VSRRPKADVRQIVATDRQIDELVCDWSKRGKCHQMAQLYGLTVKEVRIVEEGVG
jgi:hypothetical protein